MNQGEAGSERNVTLRVHPAPGDIGRVAAMHGEVYALERGWDWTFEAYVAAGLADFALRYDPTRDRLWIAEDDAGLAGSIAIASHGVDAQLRWFLVHPRARGQGLGRRLMAEALEFCRAVGYERVFLWTTSDLVEAAHLYGGFGFEITREETHDRWGASVTEQRYELALQ